MTSSSAKKGILSRAGGQSVVWIDAHMLVSQSREPYFEKYPYNYKLVWLILVGGFWVTLTPPDDMKIAEDSRMSSETLASFGNFKRPGVNIAAGKVLTLAQSRQGQHMKQQR